MMAYVVDSDRVNKRLRLVYQATIHRRNIGKRFEYSRRVLPHLSVRPGYAGFWRYHATKGWRRLQVVPWAAPKVA